MKYIIISMAAVVLVTGCLAIPKGLTFVVDDIYFNYASGSCGLYSPGSNRILLNSDCFLADGSPNPYILYHELCHAHQNYTAELVGLTFWDWPTTTEAISYAKATRLERMRDDRKILEDFARACGRYYEDPDRLKDHAPARYIWMIHNLPPLPPVISFP